eukprot:4146601-Alexandrium_andersonii.AAC.1
MDVQPVRVRRCSGAPPGARGERISGPWNRQVCHTQALQGATPVSSWHAPERVARSRVLGAP